MMPAIWLIFLVYPIQSVIAARAPAWMKVAGIALIALFGLLYLVALDRNYAMYREDSLNRQAFAWLGVLLVVAACTAPIIGIDAISFAPFVAAAAVFMLPLAVAIPLSVILMLAVLAGPFAMGVLHQYLFFGAVMAMVIIGCSITRLAIDKDTEYKLAEQRLAVADERERVARDVHDVLGHSLTVVAVKTELAEKLLDVDVDRTRAELADIRSLTRTALAEIRETVGGLRVASLADEVDAARNALASAGIVADLPDDLAVVDPRHRTVVAWALREAVTNVVRHSHATRCAVELGRDSLTVTDDGRGIRAKEGNGLRGLRERLAGVDGTLILGPGPDGQGTRLEVRL